MRILITGFGPFPAAPFNPTGPLVRRLSRERPLAMADVTLVPHIFRTSYAAVDCDLAALLRKHRPDAILMFGLASRTPHLRIETMARNAVTGAADVDRYAPTSHVIDPRQPSKLALPTPARSLLDGALAARVPASISRNAGRYLCNYLCWRAAEATRAKNGPRVAAFIHVPLVRRGPLPADPARRNRVTMPGLMRAGRGFLRAVAAAARH